MGNNTNPEYEKIIKFKSFLKLQKISLIVLAIVFLINVTVIIFGLMSENIYSMSVAYLNVFTRFIQVVAFIGLTLFQFYCIISDRKANEKAIPLAPTVTFTVLTVANTVATYIIYNYLSTGF